MKSHSICTLVFAFFHICDAVVVSSILLLFLCSISLSEYSITCLSILPMRDTLTISIHWLLRKELLCTFLYISFGGHIHSFSLGIYLEVELLGQRIGIQDLEDTDAEFSKAVLPIYIPISNMRTIVALCLFQHLVLSMFLVLAVLQVGV